MAAALRLAARKICARSFERPQAFFTTAASASVKDVQRRLPPRISHGGTLLRRFSSSESANVLNTNNKRLANNNLEQTASLATRIQEKKQELLHLLGQAADLQEFAMELENKTLLHLLRRAPGPVPGSTHEFLENNVGKLTIAATLGSIGLMYVETEYIFPLYDRVMQHFSSEKTK